MGMLRKRNNFSVAVLYGCLCLCAVVFLSFVTNRAMAGDNDLVVVEARGIALTPGQVIDGTKSLTLQEGQQVGLVAVSGLMIKLKGPYDKAPIGDQPTATGAVVGAMQALLTQKVARLDRAGVVRGGGKETIPPEPWLIDVSHPGPRCVLSTEKLVFWRSEASSSDVVLVMPSDRSWRVKSAWPADQDRFTVLPPSVLVAKRANFVVKLDKEVTISILTVPENLSNSAMQAAWMSEVGCDRQALALLNAKDTTASPVAAPPAVPASPAAAN